MDRATARDTSHTRQAGAGMGALALGGDFQPGRRIPAMAYAPIILHARLAAGLLAAGAIGTAVAGGLALVYGPALSLLWLGLALGLLGASVFAYRRATSGPTPVLAILQQWRGRQCRLMTLFGLVWASGAVIIAPALAPADATAYVLVLAVTAASLGLLSLGDRGQILALTLPTAVVGAGAELLRSGDAMVACWLLALPGLGGCFGFALTGALADAARRAGQAR